MTKQEKKALCVRLGKNIKDARQEVNLSQEKFADLLGLSRPSIVNIENGRQLPPLTILVDISKALNINLDRLISGLVSSQGEIQLEAESKKILESWKRKTQHTHSTDTINTVEEFLKDTYHSNYEQND